jgi:hypothetical protein
MLLTVLDGRVEDQSYVVMQQLRSVLRTLVKLLLAVYSGLSVSFYVISCGS